MAGSLLKMITGEESGKGRGFTSLPRPFPKPMNESEIPEKIVLRCSELLFQFFSDLRGALLTERQFDLK
jgi:hypothetical protein